MFDILNLERNNTENAHTHARLEMNFPLRVKFTDTMTKINLRTFSNVNIKVQKRKSLNMVLKAYELV